MASAPIPPSGVWTPSVTLFDPSTDRLDLESQQKYFGYLAHKTGLAGLVILGTNAETFLLTREERKQLLALARKVADAGEREGKVKIMAGVGGHSLAQVKEYIDDALEVGGIEYLLVLPPGYFGASKEVVEGFYAEVSGYVAGKGVGIVLYNFPGVCNGVDLDSETISRLAKKHDNIVGVKLTCGSVAKITRLAAEFPPERFAVFGGQSDFLLGGLSVGSAGCIAAFGNVFPKTIVQVYNLYKEGKTQEALQLHRKAALAEQALKAGGIASTKYAASVFTAPLAGIEDAGDKMRPRRPYLPPGDEVKKKIREALAEVAAIENSIVGGHS
ncbi:hypothetical protein QBC42DRAFT_87971 [Cladorrhinum samala]|uniref:4-hydroxy-2-oxoglutarate aldolase, mitochondrial n=1 Tax=Cladorrhinum samala TaxID=585594 RepID=A0AAV9HM56_9PEZI|nr:hypothetical protein QBC42DRAFT_87971 [Cladorrhinum samala]